MSGKRRRSYGAFLEGDLLRSPVYLDLSGCAPQVFAILLSKRKREKLRRPDPRGATWRTLNNGQLVFTYAEARRRGISQDRFRRAIASLVGHGLIDVTHAGGAMSGDCTLYGESDRWRDWGTERFEPASRKSDPRRIGFRGRKGVRDDKTGRFTGRKQRGSAREAQHGSDREVSEELSTDLTGKHYPPAQALPHRKTGGFAKV